MKLNNAHGSEGQVREYNYRGDIDIDQTTEESDNCIGVQSINFLSIDPIGTMLVAFDNGTVKVWQNVIKNEQLMKIMELK